MFKTFVVTSLIISLTFAGPVLHAKNLEESICMIDDELPNGLQRAEQFGNNPPSGNIHRTQLPNGETLELLLNDAAFAHVRNLKARNPKAFAASERLMRSKGWRPTNTVVVMRTLAPARSSGHDTSGVELAESIYLPEGEVVFTTWDDGNPATWEGELYAVNYQTQGVAINIGQMERASHSVLSETNVWYEPGPLVQNLALHHQSSYDTGVRIAGTIVSPATSGVRLVQRNQDGSPSLVGGLLKAWAACFVSICGMVLVSCTLGNGAYIPCVVILCYAAKTVCAVVAIIVNIP